MAVMEAADRPQEIRVEVIRTVMALVLPALAMVAVLPAQGTRRATTGLKRTLSAVTTRSRNRLRKFLIPMNSSWRKDWRSRPP